jgi:hypothetical protein
MPEGSPPPMDRSASSRPRRLPQGQQVSTRRARIGGRGRCALGWGVAAFDHHRLRELRAKIAVGSQLTEKGLAQRFRIFLRFWVWLLDLRRAAFDGVARQFRRGFGGKSEGDEEGRIVDVDLDLLALRINRLLEGQREVEREQALVVVERIVLRRLLRQIVPIPDMNECEVIEVLERLDIHFRQGLQLLGREDAVAIGVETLHRHSGVELIESPGVANPGDLVIWIEEDFRAHGHPDMRVSSGRRRAEESDGHI